MRRIQTLIGNHKLNPFFQAGVISIIAGVTMVLIRLSSDMTLESTWENIWVVLVMFLLFFALINSVSSLNSKNQTNYFWKSVTCFLILLAVLIAMAYLLSDVSYYESGFFRWIIVVIVFGYLVFFSIVMAMRRIVNYAQKQDKKFRNEE